MRTLYDYVEKNPAAEKALLGWANEFSKKKFNNFNEIKTVYRNASIIGNNRIIFNIKESEFRLIVSAKTIKRLFSPACRNIFTNFLTV